MDTTAFGKHERKTLPQVLFSDPDYFFWGFETGFFEQHGPALQSEAVCIYARATSVRIPQEESEPLLVEYRFYYSGHCSVGFRLVPATRMSHEGSTVAMRSDHVDV